MSPHKKLVIANTLMTVGVLPLACVSVWLACILSAAPGRQPIMPIIDPFVMMGIFAMSFLFTATVAGVSAAWSWDVVRACPDSRSRVALGLRLLTAALLASPFVLAFLAQTSSGRI